MASNDSIPQAPRFETVIVPPSNSSGLSFLALALTAKSLTAREIANKDLDSACLMTGVTSPSSTAMATESPMCW